jgi:hypothetical protein
VATQGDSTSPRYSFPTETLTFPFRKETPTPVYEVGAVGVGKKNCFFFLGLDAVTCVVRYTSAKILFFSWIALKALLMRLIAKASTKRQRRCIDERCRGKRRYLEGSTPTRWPAPTTSPPLFNVRTATSPPRSYVDERRKGQKGCWERNIRVSSAAAAPDLKAPCLSAWILCFGCRDGACWVSEPPVTLRGDRVRFWGSSVVG